MYEWAKAILEVEHDEGAAVRVSPMKGARIEDVKREAAAVALICNATVEFSFNLSHYRIEPDCLLGSISARGIETCQQ